MIQRRLYNLLVNGIGQGPLRYIFAIVALVGCAIAVYWPGVHGPFLFDDNANIVENEYIRITELDFSALVDAAFSSHAGPLWRPIPMATFALNYLMAGGFSNAFVFKLTNIVLHAVNGLLIFWLCYLGLRHLHRSGYVVIKNERKHLLLISFIAALLWTLHPIHLTSVLYVVQRMTSLSASFVLLSLISYIYTRTAMIAGASSIRIISGFVFVSVCAIFALFSKENAVLIPIYLLLIDLTLFPQNKPWILWTQMNIATRRLLLVTVGIAVLLATLYFADYSLSGYKGRAFTFSERILTEPRILLFYLTLILLPRVQDFGIYHDDIETSVSLLSPWTTLPSILFIAGLLLSSILLFKKHRLISFGILWFFACHLLESTFFALELAHEHRNYLATLGPIVIVLYLCYTASKITSKNWIWSIPVILGALFSIDTALRSWHWSDETSLSEFEARNHPGSARSQSYLGSTLAKAGMLEEAKAAFTRASELRTFEVTDLINIDIIYAWQNREPPPELMKETTDRVRHGLITPLTNQALAYAVNCASGSCVRMQNALLNWLPIYIERAGNGRGNIGFYRFMYAQVLLFKARTPEAITQLELAIDEMPRYLHPYFLLVTLYARTGNMDNARAVLEKLKIANKNNPHPRDRELEILSKKIQSLSHPDK